MLALFYRGYATDFYLRSDFCLLLKSVGQWDYVLNMKYEMGPVSQIGNVPVFNVFFYGNFVGNFHFRFRPFRINSSGKIYACLKSRIGDTIPVEKNPTI